jgi:hypothetical protein
MPELYTVSDIAKRLNLPIHRIDYAIASRKIAPAKVLGGSKIFDDAGFKAVADAIANIAKVEASRGK